MLNSMKMEDNPLRVNAYKFAIKICKFCRIIREEKKEFVLSGQLLRSGTSIGANIEEAQYSPTKKDFAYKLSISLKEASETRYWLMLLKDAEETEADLVDPLLIECNELIKLLTSITKKLKYQDS